MASELLESLQQHIENVLPESTVDRCEEQSCSLNLSGISNRIILKGEKTCRDKISDCIIFLEKDGLKLCIAELKSKRLHPRDIPEKLCNAARIAFEIFDSCNIEIPAPFFLVLHKGANSSEYLILSNKSVYLHGKNYPIQIKKCGSSLLDLIEQFK